MILWFYEISFVIALSWWLLYCVQFIAERKAYWLETCLVKQKRSCSVNTGLMKPVFLQISVLHSMLTHELMVAHTRADWPVRFCMAGWRWGGTCEDDLNGTLMLQPFCWEFSVLPSLLCSWCLVFTTLVESQYDLDLCLFCWNWLLVEKSISFRKGNNV